MLALAITLKELKPDVFISVGYWPVVAPAAYRQTVAPFGDELVNSHRVMIVAEQLALLDEKLVHGYVSINFEQIDRIAYRLMRAAAGGRPVPALTYDPSKIGLESR